MRTITLNRMHIANFKGIQDLEIVYDGKNTLISGYNGTGKSTIVDAYFWVTTGKNTALASRFEVRPRDDRGNEVHDVITSVECEFSVADSETPNIQLTFTIRRDELEDLTEKAKKELKPETIAKKKSYYFIDNAPYDAKIFYDKLGAILCDKDKFSILSNPMAFFALDEKDQRTMLTMACGDVQDGEVEGYDKVCEICKGIVTPIEKRDSLTKTISAMKKRIAEIPAQIKALSQNCDEYADYDKKIAELEKDQSEVQLQGAKLKDEQLNKFGAPRSVVLPLPPSNSNVVAYTYKIKDIERSIAADEKLLEIIEKSIKDNVCPQCGYDMGSRAAEKPLCEKSILKAQNDLITYRADLQHEQEKYDAAMEEYNAKVAEQSKADETALKERKSIETCIDKLRARYTELSVEISQLKQAKQVQLQVKTLRDEFRKLDDQLADYMTKLDIITAFILKKAERVVENINKRFDTVQFKLFEMQANGELKTCCKAMVNGVSYANINTAAKVQVGIELAKLFSEFYGVRCPIWCDNRESIVELPPIDTQLVCLKVDERYEELHIEEMFND